jgi:hypothetical protein
MRKMYFAAMYEGEYCILREETVRERRGSYSGFFCRLYPFICWIIIKEGPGNFSGGQDVLQDALILSVDNISESWVVDLGASFHATPDRKHFLDYVQGDFGQVQLGDNRPCKIVGMGNVKIKQ